VEEMYVPIPLYPDPDYNYFISLERVAYKLRFYYNERMQQWIMDIRYANGDPIILGEAVVPEYPIFFDYATELEGFFWLHPIGKKQNHTVANPYQLSEYYQLFYFYEG